MGNPKVVKPGDVLVFPSLGLVQILNLSVQTYDGTSYPFCTLKSLYSGRTTGMLLSKVTRNVRIPVSPERAQEWLDNLTSEGHKQIAVKNQGEQLKKLREAVNSSDLDVIAKALGTLCPRTPEQRAQVRAEDFRQGAAQAASEIAYVLKLDCEECRKDIMRRLGYIEHASVAPAPAPSKQIEEKLKRKYIRRVDENKPRKKR